MKKLILSALAITTMGGAAMLLTSCTREYTCQCTITYTGQPGLPDPVMKEYKITDTKKEAESKCRAHSETTDVNGITTTEACDLW